MERRFQRAKYVVGFTACPVCQDETGARHTGQMRGLLSVVRPSQWFKTGVSLERGRLPCACRAPAVRLTAALADRYRIERELGAGGMATVLRSAIACCRRSVVFMVRRIRDGLAHRHGYRYHDKPVDATKVVGIAGVHG